jgi:hypothetical protein
MLSPFATDELVVGPRFMHSPPSLFIEVSKDSLVLVDGSKKSNPSILPSSSRDFSREFAISSSLPASSKINSISSFVKSFNDITLLSLKIITLPKFLTIFLFIHIV